MNKGDSYFLIFIGMVTISFTIGFLTSTVFGFMTFGIGLITMGITARILK